MESILKAFGESKPMHRADKLYTVALLAAWGWLMPARGQAQEPAGKPPAGVLAEFPVFTDGDILLIPVSVGGREYSFMVDTGFSTTTFDSRLSAALTQSRDPAARAVKVTGAGNLQAAVAGEFRIEGLPPFRAHAVWHGDLSRLRESTGHAVFGIIGSDILRQLVLQIDADAGRLQILRQSPAGQGMPLAIRWRTAGTPTVRALLAPGVSDDLILDTGNFSLEPIVDLATPLYDKLEQRGALKTLYRATSARVDKIQEARTGVLAELTLLEGPTFKSLRASEHPEGLNLLGLAALLQFNVVFDFPGDRLLLEPRKKKLEVRFPTHGSGMALLRRDGTTFVHNVRKGSRAAAAGLREQEIVEFASGKLASDYRLHELRLLIETAGSNLQLAVRPPNGELRSVLLPRQDGP